MHAEAPLSALEHQGSDMTPAEGSGDILRRVERQNEVLAQLGSAVQALSAQVSGHAARSTSAASSIPPSECSSRSITHSSVASERTSVDIGSVRGLCTAPGGGGPPSSSSSSDTGFRRKPNPSKPRSSPNKPSKPAGSTASTEYVAPAVQSIPAWLHVAHEGVKEQMKSADDMLSSARSLYKGLSGSKETFKAWLARAADKTLMGAFVDGLEPADYITHREKFITTCLVLCMQREKHAGVLDEAAVQDGSTLALYCATTSITEAAQGRIGRYGKLLEVERRVQAHGSQSEVARMVRLVNELDNTMYPANPGAVTQQRNISLAKVTFAAGCNLTTMWEACRRREAAENPNINPKLLLRKTIERTLSHLRAQYVQAPGEATAKALCSKAVDVLQIDAQSGIIKTEEAIVAVFQSIESTSEFDQALADYRVHKPMPQSPRNLRDEAPQKTIAAVAGAGGEGGLRKYDYDCRPYEFWRPEWREKFGSPNHPAPRDCRNLWAAEIMKVLRMDVSLLEGKSNHLFGADCPFCSTLPTAASRKWVQPGHRTPGLVSKGVSELHHIGDCNVMAAKAHEWVRNHQQDSYILDPAPPGQDVTRPA